MITKSQIQLKLIDAIKHSGMTQEQIAKEVGVKRQQISCYLRGEKLPAIDTLANLCRVLSVDANDLLCCIYTNKE